MLKQKLGELYNIKIIHELLLRFQVFKEHILNFQKNYNTRLSVNLVYCKKLFTIFRVDMKQKGCLTNQSSKSILLFSFTWYVTFAAVFNNSYTGNNKDKF